LGSFPKRPQVAESRPSALHIKSRKADVAGLISARQDRSPPSKAIAFRVPFWLYLNKGRLEGDAGGSRDGRLFCVVLREPPAIFLRGDCSRLLAHRTEVTMEKSTIIFIGIVCVIGAIIGGGIKVIQVELRTFDSLWRQVSLGVFGVALIVYGLIGSEPGQKPEVPATQSRSTDSQITAGASDQNSEGPANPSHSTDSQTMSGATDTVALPSKVDIFWCDGRSAGFNHNLANQIGAAVDMASPSTRQRVRPFAEATNSGQDYQIHHAIVRYDPGELSQAKRLAEIASKAAGLDFRATPALPGTPSVDYLSVFVCD
jgi:hypothetical protein